MEITNLDFGAFMEIYGGLFAGYNIPQNLMKTLHRKLNNEEFNTGEYFSLIADNEKAGKYHSAVTCEEGLECSDEEAIFLVDHAVTYEVNNARQLLENADLLHRVANIVGCPDETDVEVVMKQMWKFNQTYSVPSVESPKVRTPLWYILDEFGSAIHHCDEANVMMIPFYYQPRQMSYSILWLLSDVEYGDRLVRDFSFNEKDPTLRRCKLLPWIDDDLTKDVDPTPTVVTEGTFHKRFEISKETLPEEQKVVEIEEKSDGKLKIYFDKYQPGLTDDQTFEMVDNMDDADVIWNMDHIKDFKGMSVDHPKKFLNQFPCEQVMVNKDFFAAISMRGSANGDVPSWLPVTFNLQTELPQFVAYYQKLTRKADNEKVNNIWICKPWNLARGIQIQVSEDLNEIIRLRETETPQIVSKYIHNPVLYHRSDVNCDVKFTLRCYVVLKSVAPLQLFVSKLTRLHFANQQYEKNKFDEYDRHFTVMNYFQDGKDLKEIGLEEFVPNFEKQYSGQKWDDVLDHTHSCIREFFLSATNQEPPFGVGHYDNSRALYAIDILLKWKEDSQDMQPMLLECNFCPDCTQTCQTDANFMNKIFKFCFTQASADECDLKDISI